MDRHPFSAFQQHVNDLFNDFSRDFFDDQFFKDEFPLNPTRNEQRRLYSSEPSTQQQLQLQQQPASSTQSSADQRLSTLPSSSQRGLRPWNNWNNWMTSSFHQQPPVQCKVDVIQEKDKYVVQADLPGVDKNNVQLNIEDGYLTLRGDRRAQYEDKDDKDGHRWMRREVNYGSVERRLALPRDIDQTKISAKHEDGVLKVILPRVEKHQQQGRVTIQ